MTPNSEQWHRIKEIFTEANELEPSKRSDFLDKACAENPSLRAEVESLLTSHGAAGDFMEKPLFEAAPRLFEQAGWSSPVGQRLGHYLVTSELGQGGMGMVFLAHDTVLGRQVAMKALAPEFTRGEQHKERLRREARAAASLAHPGIATVYSLEEFNGIQYIVSEYIRGETMRTELAQRSMPDKVLWKTAVELAQAVAAAHAQGIIHRDLKPENVIRTADGRIKILDFGLAAVRDETGAAESREKGLTEAGTFVGTASYASPEQLRGREVGFGTDVFSLGVMIYEMASGIHPFGGGNSISTIARILEREPPDLAQVHELVPAGLDAVVRKCLNKNPADRYPSARELLNDLEVLGRENAIPSLLTEASASAKGRDESGQRARRTPVWWWQFHQVVVGLGYYLVLYPIWGSRGWMPGVWGTVMFLASVVAVGVASNLRLHLCFTSRSYPHQLARQRKRVGGWILFADLAFSIILLAIGTAIYRSHAFWAALHVGIAIAILVSVLAIEPATASAAFGSGEDGRHP